MPFATSRSPTWTAGLTIWKHRWILICGRGADGRRFLSVYDYPLGTDKDRVRSGHLKLRHSSKRCATIRSLNL